MRRFSGGNDDGRALTIAEDTHALREEEVKINLSASHGEGWVRSLHPSEVRANLILPLSRAGCETVLSDLQVFDGVALSRDAVS